MKRFPWRHVFLLALGLGVISLAVEAAEDKPGASWPVFRGNALQTGVAASSLPDKLDIRWTFTAPDGFEGAAAIVKGMVYVGCLDGHLYALDLDSGMQKWKYKAGAAVKVAPGVRAGAVYFGDEDGTFHCVDAATGKERWTFKTEAEIASSANFAGDSVLFGSYDETLYCLGLDGKERWKFKVAGGPVLGCPAVAGERTFVSGCDSNLHVLDTKTGKELNSVNLEGQTGSSAAVVGDQLYVGTMTNQVLAVDWKKGEVPWRFESQRRPQPFYSSVAVTDTLVIAGSRNKHVYGLDRKTGNEIWSFAAKEKVDSSPVIVDKRVFVGCFDGNLYVLDLARGTELRHIQLGREISASPAVAEQCLVIGTLSGRVDENGQVQDKGGTVYCLGVKK